MNRDEVTRVTRRRTREWDKGDGQECTVERNPSQGPWRHEGTRESTLEREQEQRIRVLRFL